MKNTKLKDNITQIYNSRENLTYYNTQHKNGIAVIYFSSNGLWDLKNPETFVSNVVQQDKFEFMKIHMHKAERHIFVRDVYINWYFLGINKQVNSIDKLKEKLMELTNGYKVITMGVSGGGYMAMLMGSWLNAEYVISFSGQIDILKFAHNINYHFPFCNIKKASIKKYLNIQQLLNKNPVCIFNVVAVQNNADKENIELSMQTKCIHTFLMDTNKHQMPLSKKFFSYYINLNKQQWLELHKKIQNKIISPKKLDHITIPLLSRLKLYIIFKMHKLIFKHLR